MEEPTIDQDLSKADREHDLLSFLSVIFHEYSSFDSDFTLLGIIVDELAFDIRQVGAGGSYFSVHKVNGKSLLDRRKYGTDLPAEEGLFSELVAIKSPIIKGEVNSTRNRKIWTAMAQEVMILRNTHLSKHDSVVSLLGVCWHQSSTEPSSIMPALVLEAAEMDLEAFMAPGKGVELRKLLGLAVDILAGVQAIHDCGIAHCDLKPKNILICKHPDLKYVAKVADFGCAILLSPIKDKFMPSGATELWQAPECSQPLSGEGLKQADMYSAGLIIWNILTANLAVTLLERVSSQGRHLLNEEHSKPAILGHLIRKSVNLTWELPIRYSDSGTEIEAPRKTDVEMILMAAICLSPETRCTAKPFLSNLRLLLHQFLRYEVLAGLTDLENISSSPSNFNSQEQDIWLNPSLEEPTDEDRERIMHFAKSMEWMHKAFAAIESSRPVKMDDLANYKVSHPEQYIGATMRQWEMAKQPAPEAQREVCNSLAVLEADHSFGTLRLTPPPVVDQVYQQLQAVALNTKELKVRRAEAAYQYAILSIGRLQLHDDASAQVEQCLEMSSLAASLGHTSAQSITDSFHRALRKDQSQEPSNIELKWLRRGVKNGSLAAKKRLLNLNPELHFSAVKSLRTQYAGIGMQLPLEYKYTSDREFEEILEKALSSRSEDERVEIFMVLVVLWREKEVKRLIDKVNVNVSNQWQETPLLAACRVGNAFMVGKLLDADADPNIASVEGVTPLHFLAAFNDEDIQPVARRLVEKGAELETRSSRAGGYRKTYDSTFGQANGTPLLWAVAADNVVATGILVKLGADPFDLQGQQAPVTNRFGSLIWVSPVMYAATKHQYYLLELMLAPQKKSPWNSLKSMWLPSIKQHLNDNKRNLGTLGAVDNSTPLDHCVTYAAEGLTKRLLLHGPEHENAFVRTFEILVRAGVDPFPGGSEDNSLMYNAALYGQPFVINFLMRWNENVLRPSPKQWLYLVKLAISTSDYVVFETWLQHSRAQELDANSLTEFFAFVAATTDDIRFLDPFKTLRDPAQDFVDILEVAVQRGNIAMMKWFYSSGCCDLARHRDDRSVLGTLISGSKTFDSRLKSIEALLSLEDLPDGVFYDCFIFYESRLTALQAAVLHFEYWEGKKAAEWSVHVIVSRWSEPLYLNYQITEGRYKGCTALHMAVHHTNVAAVRYLLDEEADSLDLSILDDRGLTVLDAALLQLADQKSKMDFWQVPPEKQAAADELHWSNTLLIIASLSKAGAKPHQFASAWVRQEPDSLSVFDAWGLQESTYPLLPCLIKDARRLFAMTPEETQKLPRPLQEAARLAVNKAMFVISEEYAAAHGLKKTTYASVARQQEDEAARASSPQTLHEPLSQPEVEDDGSGGASLSTLVGHLQLQHGSHHVVSTVGKGKGRAD